MKIADPTVVMPTVPPPAMQATVDAVRPNVDGGKAARERRDGNQQPQDKGTTFRAALDAASVGGLGQALAAFAGESPASTSAPRPERRPSGTVELDAVEADSLYRAAKTSAGPTNRAHRAREYFAASREYAQRFFSVGGTNASRGETLELRA